MRRSVAATDGVLDRAVHLCSGVTAAPELKRRRGSTQTALVPILVLVAAAICAPMFSDVEEV
jgi:hypothetical protein